jgi:hypothetical protein
MESEQQEQTGKKPIDPSLADRPNVDWYLQTLVSMANEHGVEMGITLTLGGTVVTGQLIGGKTYFETFAEVFGNAWSEDEQARKEMRATMARPAEMYGPKKADSAGPSFIHLKNAKIRTPDGCSMPDQGVLWRGRLSEVSGFFLGILG